MLEAKDKIIIGLVVLMLIITVGFMAYTKYEERKYRSEVVQLNNQLAEAIGTVKIGGGTYQALVRMQSSIEDYLSMVDSTLDKRLKEMDLSIVALTDANVKLKDQIFKMGGKNGGKVTSEEVNIKTKDPQTNKEDTVKKTKVSFEKIETYFGVKGFTLNPPPEAEVTIFQTGKLRLISTIVKDNNGVFQNILKFPDDFPIQDMEIVSIVDLNAILDAYTEKWYNKFYVGGMAFVTRDGIILGPSVGYKFGNILISPSVLMDNSLRIWYGFDVKYNILGK